VVLGDPISCRSPECVGVRLEGTVAPWHYTTDVALTLTRVLRSAGVVGACVEFFGSGEKSLTVPDRARLPICGRNMVPPRDSGRSTADARLSAPYRTHGRTCALVEAHARAAGPVRDRVGPIPPTIAVIPFDLSKAFDGRSGTRHAAHCQEPATVAASFRARAAKNETDADHAEGRIAVWRHCDRIDYVVHEHVQRPWP